MTASWMIYAAHAEGRRFYVGTMNLETKRLAIWDLGAIASSGRPNANELVRKVLLAAISWPGAVPPVAFDIEVDGHCYREEHCDAGSVAMALPPMGPLPLCPAGSDLYLFASRKLYSEPEPVPKRAFHRLKPSVTAIFEALTRSNICNIYSQSLVSGFRFHLMSVPQDYRGEVAEHRPLVSEGSPPIVRDRLSYREQRPMLAAHAAGRRTGRRRTSPRRPRDPMRQLIKEKVTTESQTLWRTAGVSRLVLPYTSRLTPAVRHDVCDSAVRFSSLYQGAS